MKWEIQHKQAFTLIEMLLVITIIGILAVIILSQYATATRSARLSASVDAVVAEIKEARDNSVNGLKNQRFPDYTCYGVSFRRNNATTVSAIVGRLDSQNDTCNFSAGVGYLDSFELERGLEINSAYFSSDNCAVDACTNEMIFFFMPPEGRFKAKRRSGRTIGNADDYVRVELGQPGKDLASPFVKAVEVGYPGGKIEVIN